MVAGALRFFWENKIKNRITLINHHRAKNNSLAGPWQILAVGVHLICNDYVQTISIWSKLKS